MGTNYYAVLNKCASCKRHEQLHIGKRSGGWMFSFRGHTDSQPVLRSSEDWRLFLQDKTVMNEYGEELSPAEFWQIVTATKDSWAGKPPLNHFDYCNQRGYPTLDQWKDPEGWSFSETEFS